MNRHRAADEALANYDFEPSMVTDTGRWEEDGERWLCRLWFDDENCEPYTAQFNVIFEPNSDRVVSSYCGDPIVFNYFSEG